MNESPEPKRHDVTYLCSRQAVEDESWIGEHDDWFGEGEAAPINDLSASVKLVDAVLAAAKRAGLILVDEVSGIVVPDASETIRRYLPAAPLPSVPPPTYTEVERLDRPGNRADLEPRR